MVDFILKRSTNGFMSYDLVVNDIHKKNFPELDKIVDACNDFVQKQIDKNRLRIQKQRIKENYVKKQKIANSI